MALPFCLKPCLKEKRKRIKEELGRDEYRPKPCAEGRDTEGGRKRGAKAWHPDGGRSTDPTGQNADWMSTGR